MRTDIFFKKYEVILKNEGKNLDYTIDRYLQLLADVNYETIQFFHTGEYSNTSFVVVNREVYNNPEVMDYHLHGLLLSQFLWKQHYNILLWFNFILNKDCNKIKNYLEVGGGHGLYISEAIEIIGEKANYDMVDISQISLNIAHKMINHDKVKYILSDIFEYNPLKTYDFIAMGEVLEHVEEPVKLLLKLKSLLSENGKIFITTPTNAPAIDHIYLFKNAGDIREVIIEAGFQIENEVSIYSEDVTSEVAEKKKVSMMFGAILSKLTKQLYPASF